MAIPDRVAALSALVRNRLALALAVVVAVSGGIAALTIVSWNSSWHDVGLASSIQGTFNSVSCSTAGACIAVGARCSSCRNPYGKSWPLVESAEVSGGPWNVAALPAGAGGYGQLLASQCMQDSCFVAGYSCSAACGSVSAVLHPLLLSERSGIWRTAVSGALARTRGALLALGCAGNGCMAAGWSGTSPFAFAWNGHSWSAASSGLAGSHAYLTSVSCLAPSQCWAAGSVFSTHSGIPVAVLMHWNGHFWSDRSLSSLIPQSSASSAVTALYCGKGACMLLGTNCTTGCSTVGALTSTWGARYHAGVWRLVPVQEIPVGTPLLPESVSCVSASSCWGVGYAVGYASMAPNGLYPELLLYWNGTAWQERTAENVHTTVVGLSSVACTTAGSCYAVGGQLKQHAEGPVAGYSLLEEVG